MFIPIHSLECTTPSNESATQTPLGYYECTTLELIMAYYFLQHEVFLLTSYCPGQLSLYVSLRYSFSFDYKIEMFTTIKKSLTI